MCACATNEFERSAIDDMLFGSVTDVLDRYVPDREKHGALRGLMTVLAVNIGMERGSLRLSLDRKRESGVTHVCDSRRPNSHELRV